MWRRTKQYIRFARSRSILYDWATCLKHMPVCKQHLHGKLPLEGNRQVTCPPDLSLYLPHVNAAHYLNLPLTPLRGGERAIRDWHSENTQSTGSPLQDRQVDSFLSKPSARRTVVLKTQRNPGKAC
jgi:hypothetical protein